MKKWILFVALWLQPNVVGGAEVEVWHFYVTFSSAVSDRPYIDRDGTLAYGAGAGKVTLPPIAPVGHITCAVPGPSNDCPKEGPWIVTIVSASDPATIEQDIQNVVEVVSCSHIPVGTPLSDYILGESNRAWFPPEADPVLNGEGFCERQRYLHFPGALNDPEPTLHSTGADECSWYRPIWESQESFIPDDIDLPEAWAITRGSDDVVVAVLDLSMDWSHPELGGTWDAHPPGATVEERMQFYSQGSMYLNEAEEPGDGGDIGCSGDCGEDEDDDGVADEDPTGLLPGT